MSETKFTKGEWNYDRDDLGVWINSDLYAEPIAKMCSSANHSVKANAQLIAAAPDLLKALSDLVEKCLHSDGYKQKYDELYHAQQAIKKATE